MLGLQLRGEPLLSVRTMLQMLRVRSGRFPAKNFTAPVDRSTAGASSSEKKSKSDQEYKFSFFRHPLRVNRERSLIGLLISACSKICSVLFLVYIVFDLWLLVPEVFRHADVP